VASVCLPFIRHRHAHASVDLFDHRRVQIRRDDDPFLLHLFKVAIRSLHILLLVESVFNQLRKHVAQSDGFFHLG